ncbi:MAG: proline dehydrogenase [Bacillaceae bacterium]|nr:proline dehydrogenase [Bacillaceae bacterium]
METLMRNFFLYLSKNRTMNQAARKWGLQFGAQRFVAGESIADAIATIRRLNDQGLLATVDHLGEFVSSKEEATESTDYALKTLDAIADAGVKSQLSVKLTQLGLDIDYGFCLDNMRKIVDRAKNVGNFVRIDMEDYARLEMTLSILKDLLKDYDNVGTVIQAYLYRSENDVQDLDAWDVNLRLVKGAYKESPKVAFPDKKDVDENFKKLIRLHLENGNYTAVATHDDRIIDFTRQLAEEKRIPRDRFEFQMLYGIRPQYQQELAREGYRMRVYVPYGKDWYGYFMRRLAERPANVGFVLKGMLRRS